MEGSVVLVSVLGAAGSAGFSASAALRATLPIRRAAMVRR